MVVAPGVTVEKVFGPEEPGDYKHPAAITELANGDLYLAYYCGSGEYGDDTAVYGARLKKGTTAWTKPKVIADTPWLSEGNPVVWQGPDGLVWLFYVNRYGETWSNSRIKAKISKDGAETWSDSFMLAMEEGMMVRGKPIVLAGGDYLLPIYHETGHDRENVGDDTTGLFLRYDVKKKKWSETNRITARLGCLQPAVAQITDKYLVAYCRRGGGYFPRSDGWMIRSESRDGGRTWSKGVETKFPNPNAAVDLVRLQNGHLMLVYNDSMWKRAPLTVAISTDNDQSYPIKKNILEGPGPYAYPYAIQTRDGKIHVIFTSNNRTTVYHAVFEESAILEGAGR
jgi:predicted neuraminidase